MRGTMEKLLKAEGAISDKVQRASAALRAMLELNDNGNPQWHEHAQICRKSLKELAQSPSLTTNDLLEKARMLALITPCDHLNDHRYELAQSILEDLKSFGKP